MSKSSKGFDLFLVSLGSEVNSVAFIEHKRLYRSFVKSKNCLITFENVPNWKWHFSSLISLEGVNFYGNASHTSFVSIQSK